MTRLFTELRTTHAFPVRRAKEVMRWVQSGDYDRIIGGDYPRRGDDVHARGAAGDAVEYYSDRFRAIFRETGENVAGAGGRMAEWLRGGR